MRTLPKPKSLATFSHAPAGIQTRALVRDSDNMLDHMAIRAGP